MTVVPVPPNDQEYVAPPTGLVTDKVTGEPEHILAVYVKAGTAGSAVMVILLQIESVQLVLVSTMVRQTEVEPAVLKVVLKLGLLRKVVSPVLAPVHVQ